MPSNTQLPSSGLKHPGLGAICLDQRIQSAFHALTHCNACEHRCGANRQAGQVGLCGAGADTYCIRRYISLANDLDIIPALRVYLAGCNLRCRFCSGPDAFVPTAGQRVNPAELGAEFDSAIQRGVRTIQLIGGEPSLHVHTILSILATARSPLSLLLDTNLYMTPEVIELLDGLIGTYSANLKFGNNRCARDLAGAERYVDVITRNLRLLGGHADVRIRYLLLPGHVHCCLRPILERLSGELPGARFDLLTGYMPSWQADQFSLGRLVTPTELCEARSYLEQSVLNWRVDVDGPRP